MKLKPEKKIQAWTGLEPMTSAILIPPTELSSQLGVDHVDIQNILVEGEEDKWIYENSYMNCGKWYEDMIDQVSREPLLYLESSLIDFKNTQLH